MIAYSCVLLMKLHASSGSASQSWGSGAEGLQSTATDESQTLVVAFNARLSAMVV